MNRETVRQQAMHWLVRKLNPAEWSAEDERHLQSWLKVRPEHLDEFLAAQATLAVMSQPGAFDSAEIARVLARPPVASRQTFTRRRLAGLATAAVLTLSATGAWMIQNRNTYSTGIAETRQITLPDGTHVHLDAQTSLHYEATESGRTVHLRHGAAVFEVAPHRAPFKVAADTWSVRDIGTTFQVLLRNDAPRGTVEVGVAEGEVELTSDRHPATPPVRLSSGEETTWEGGSDRPSAKIHNASPGDFAAWRDGRLRYRNRPLSQVLADLQRYQKNRLVLLDPELARLTVTGTLSTRDLKQAYTALEQILPLRFAVQASGEVQVLRR